MNIGGLAALTQKSSCCIAVFTDRFICCALAMPINLCVRSKYANDNVSFYPMLPFFGRKWSNPKDEGITFWNINHQVCIYCRFCYGQACYLSSAFIAFILGTISVTSFVICSMSCKFQYSHSIVDIDGWTVHIALGMLQHLINQHCLCAIRLKKTLFMCLLLWMCFLLIMFWVYVD